MRKAFILFLIFLFSCGPSDAEIQNRIDAAVEEALDTTTTTTTTATTTTTYLYNCEDWNNQVNETLAAVSWSNSSSRVTLEKYTEFYGLSGVGLSDITEEEIYEMINTHYQVFYTNAWNENVELMEITDNANISDDQILISDTIDWYLRADGYVWITIKVSLEDPNYMTPQIQEIMDDRALDAFNYNKQLKSLVGDYESGYFDFLINRCEE